MSEVAVVGQVTLWMMRHGIVTLISGGRDNKFLDTEAGHLDLFQDVIANGQKYLA